MTTTSLRPMVAAVAAAAVLSGCTSTSDDVSPTAEATPHGHVEGAEETAEPQWRLVVAEAETGTLSMVNPATEKTSELGEVAEVSGMGTDGRFVFAATGDAASVIDSGVWTVDHGDHKHYYVAEPRTLDDIEAGPVVGATGDTRASVLNTRDGASVFDRPSLEDGKIAPVDTDADLAAPHAKRLITVNDGAIAVDGERLDTSCRQPATAATTDRGAVFGCGDGVVVVSEDDGRFSAEAVAYPDGVSGVGRFAHRPGTPVLASAMADAVTVFDVAEREWTVIEVSDPVAVNATGPDMPVLVLDRDGVLRSFDPHSGDEIAQRRVIETMPGNGPAPVLTVDTERAYVNDPEARAIHEIDYQDDIRLARSFTLDSRPDFMVETGW